MKRIIYVCIPLAFSVEYGFAVRLSTIRLRLSLSNVLINLTVFSCCAFVSYTVISKRTLQFTYIDVAMRMAVRLFARAKYATESDVV